MTDILRTDLHMHSNNSVDGRNTIDEMCRAAIDKGFGTVCFTEHYDLNPRDHGYNFLSFQQYADHIERARDQYAGELQILKGIEFSEPHEHQHEFEEVLRMDFDYVLGSVHDVEGYGDYWENGNRPGFPVKRFFDDYYRTVLAAVEFGGFDALAHLDFPRRFLKKKSYEPGALLERICETLVRQHIVLELNSRPINKKYREPNPARSICALYAKKGGVKVVVGSDAHGAEMIGLNFDIVADVVGEFGYTPVQFVQRQEQPIG